MSIFEIVEKEISELHDFFEKYFKGKIDSNIDRFAKVLDRNFELITPSADIVGRNEIIDIIKKSYNTRLDIKIWTEDVKILKISDEIIGAIYFELQKSNGSEPTKRISSALFRKDENAPNGLIWIHVHETWMN